MSVLDRRRFLTGGLVSTLFAMSEQSMVMQDAAVPATDKKKYLSEVLAHYLPQVDENIRVQIADKYGDVEITPLRSLAAGAAAGATYGYLEIRAGDEPEERNKNTFFDKFAAAVSLPYATNNGTAHVLSGAQSADEIYQEISHYRSDMSEDEMQRCSAIISNYQMSWQKSKLGILPGVVTALSKESWEGMLDRWDNNVDNDNNDGPK